MEKLSIEGGGEDLEQIAAENRSTSRKLPTEVKRELWTEVRHELPFVWLIILFLINFSTRLGRLSLRGITVLICIYNSVYRNARGNSYCVYYSFFMVIGPNFSSFNTPNAKKIKKFSYFV